MKIPLAAKQLVAQVAQYVEDAQVVTSGEPDGFGRYRSIRFDAEATDYLKSWDEGLIEDPRFESFALDDGELTVTFVGDRRADDRTPFKLGPPALLEDQPVETDETTEPVKPDPPAKKAAARKTAKKTAPRS